MAQHGRGRTGLSRPQPAAPAGRTGRSSTRALSLAARGRGTSARKSTGAPQHEYTTTRLAPTKSTAVTFIGSPCSRIRRRAGQPARPAACGSLVPGQVVVGGDPAETGSRRFLRHPLRSRRRTRPPRVPSRLGTSTLSPMAGVMGSGVEVVAADRTARSSPPSSCPRSRLRCSARHRPLPARDQQSGLRLLVGQEPEFPWSIQLVTGPFGPL